MNDNKKAQQVTVISGKGGTGKSSIISALAYILKDCSILIDADVDAADLYLLFPPDKSETFEYRGTKKALINQEVCTKCNICYESCRFDAITPDLVVNNMLCDGCSLCYHICPVDAISMIEIVNGNYYISETRIGTMVHANLKPGEESSGLLVSEVRKKGRRVAANQKKDLILVDGSPGIGCPVIASLTGADYALIVPEPTLSGLHDLKRILELLKQFQIKGNVIINRFDINEEISQKIIEYCEGEFPVVAKVPYSPFFVEAMIEKRTIMELEENDDHLREIQNIMRDLVKTLMKKIEIGYHLL